MKTLIQMTALAGLFLSAPAIAQDEAPAEEPAAKAAGAVDYNINASKSWLYVVVYKDPDAMASGMGHDHMVRATEFDGQVTWDAADPSTCKIKFTVPVSKLVADPPGGRERAKLDPGGAVSAKNLETIKKNFLGGDQLDAKNHPTITFESTSCSGSGSDVKVDGNLTVRGKTKAVSTTMNVTADGSSFKAGGAFKATHSDFGFKPYSAMLGALRNANQMKFVVDVVGSK